MMQKCCKIGCENDAHHIFRKNGFGGKFYEKLCDLHYQRAVNREKILKLFFVIFVTIFGSVVIITLLVK